VFIPGEIWEVVGICDEWQRDRSWSRSSKCYSIYATSQDWEGCERFLGKVKLHCSVYIPINHDLWPNLLFVKEEESENFEWRVQIGFWEDQIVLVESTPACSSCTKKVIDIVPNSNWNNNGMCAWTTQWN
jgi:hypothetical protein